MLVETLMFFVILVIYKTSGYRNLFISNNREDLNFEIINQISTLLTLETGLVLVTQSTEDYQNLYVNHFLESSEYPLEIAHKSIAWSLVKSKRLDNFIITTTLDALYKNTKTFVMKRGFYFFIIMDNVIVNYNETKPIFQAAWENHRTLHVYLLTYKGGIIAFDPFIYDYASSDYGIVLPLAERKSVEELFTNLNGYPINIEVFRSVYSYLVTGSDGNVIDIRGADAEVAFEIGKQMNFVILLQKPDKFNFGYLTENGTFNGALGRAISNQVDMTLTGYFIKDYFTRDVEFTVAVSADQLCCYVPKAERVPQSILPLFSLSTDMWMCFCLTGLACGAIWSAIRCFNLALFRQRNFNYNKRWRRFQFVQIFIDTWIVWVRVSLRKFPGFDAEKVFLGSVCLVSVIFGAIFESSLATIYIRPLYYKDITTLQELDASGYEILYKYASMGDDAFAKGSSALFTRLANKMRFVDFSESLMDRMIKKKGFASITRKSSIKLDNVKYFASNELFMIPECPKTYTLAYVLPKDSPFAERVNLLLLRFLRAGLIDKWVDKMYYQAKLDNIKKNRRTAAVGAKVLTMGDLQLPFIVLVSGGTFGFVVLLGEKYLMQKIYSTYKKLYK